jgi:hypothetical protein
MGIFIKNIYKNQPISMAIITIFIISMTKLLDAECLRGVQLFYAVQLMIFPKQTKWRKGILNTNVK